MGIACELECAVICRIANFVGSARESAGLFVFPANALPGPMNLLHSGACRNDQSAISRSSANEHWSYWRCAMSANRVINDKLYAHGILYHEPEGGANRCAVRYMSFQTGWGDFRIWPPEVEFPSATQWLCLSSGATPIGTFPGRAKKHPVAKACPGVIMSVSEKLSRYRKTRARDPSMTWHAGCAEPNRCCWFLQVRAGVLFADRSG